MTEAIIFDMDGVLADSEALIREAAMEMFEEKGARVAPEDFLPFVGAGENRYLGGVAEKHGVPFDVEADKARTYALYLEKVPDRLVVFPGAAAFIRACRDAGLATAVASSADWIKVEANLRKIGCPPESFEAVIAAEDVERRKPWPDLFLAAAARIGAEPGRCVVLEDALNGVRAARAAGMACVGVATSFPETDLVAAGADLVVPSIADLTVAQVLGLGAGP